MGTVLDDHFSVAWTARNQTTDLSDFTDFFRGVRLRHTWDRSALNGQKSYKIGSESNRIWGEAPVGASYSWGRLTARNYSKIKFKINRAAR